ncbi:flagellar hook-length control protein FliK [Microbulbifer litoralis]|uniref:flagellar hook-length control protein FliK n=1 Tax=Microbulbifer litoralis TaxID=2933965 RepID=UPI00202858CD|nr:flagellar hook-length control protein FliK [Microbulbifer sp. GX H0434]
MDITALLARTAKVDAAPADNRSAGDGPAFKRTLSAAIAAAGNASDPSAAQSIRTGIAETEALFGAGVVPPSIAESGSPASPLQATAPAADPLPGEMAAGEMSEVVAGENDTDTAAETGNAAAPVPLLAAVADTPRSASPAVTETPASASTAAQPLPSAAAAPGRTEADTAIANATTAAADIADDAKRPANGNFRSAVAATVDDGNAFEAAGSTGRNLSAGPAEISAPTPATAAAPVASAPAAAPTTAAPAQASLPSPLASTAWQQELGQQLQGMVQRGDGSVELHLNPRELGPLSVNLQLDDQGARAHFLSAHASVRSAVEQAVPQLREALAEQGISLGDTSVGEQRQESARDDSAGGGNGSGGGSLATRDTETSSATVQTNTTIGSGRVDLYA